MRLLLNSPSHPPTVATPSEIVPDFTPAPNRVGKLPQHQRHGRRPHRMHDYPRPFHWDLFVGVYGNCTQRFTQLTMHFFSQPTHRIIRGAVNDLTLPLRRPRASPAAEISAYTLTHCGWTQCVHLLRVMMANAPTCLKNLICYLPDFT